MPSRESARIEIMVTASEALIEEFGECPSVHRRDGEMLHCCLPAGHGTTVVLPGKRWHYGWDRHGHQWAWQGSDEPGFEHEIEDVPAGESYGAEGEG